jgi:hypothetical protein
MQNLTCPWAMPSTSQGALIAPDKAITKVGPKNNDPLSMAKFIARKRRPASAFSNSDWFNSRNTNLLVRRSAGGETCRV